MKVQAKVPCLLAIQQNSWHYPHRRHGCQPTHVHFIDASLEGSRREVCSLNKPIAYQVDRQFPAPIEPPSQCRSCVLLNTMRHCVWFGVAALMQSFARDAQAGMQSVGRLASLLQLPCFSHILLHVLPATSTYCTSTGAQDHQWRIVVHCIEVAVR